MLSQVGHFFIFRGNFMKLKFTKIALLGSVFLSLISINALANDRESDLPSLGKLLGHTFIDIADDAVENVDGPVINNTVVNIGKVDASIDLQAYDSIEYKGSTFGSNSSVKAEAGTGVLGNNLGESVTWGNSIDTMANGAYASVLVVGKDVGCYNNDFFTSGAILNTAFNTAQIDASVSMKSSHDSVEINNLHISTQAIGAYGSVTLANSYQKSRGD